VGDPGKGRYQIIDDVLTDVKSTLSLVDTFVPLIFMSDGKHLLNSAGDKTECPVFMTFGNLSSKILQMPSTRNILMIAHWPILITNRNISHMQLDAPLHTKREVLNEVLYQVLQPLVFNQNPSTEGRYYNVLCAYGKFTHCKPVSAAWLADCQKYRDLHHLE
jgi:hypothetical protein